jgi:hypothetical protein
MSRTKKRPKKRSKTKNVKDRKILRTTKCRKQKCLAPKTKKTLKILEIKNARRTKCHGQKIVEDKNVGDRNVKEGRKSAKDTK